MLRNDICIREKLKSPIKEKFKNEMKFIESVIESETKSSLILPLAPNISQLNDLSELEISDNNFVELTQLLSLLANLKKLTIHNKTLKSLPNITGTLQNLCIINLSHNQLSELPDSLSDLTKLEELILSHNELDDLPLSFTKLQRLKLLDISNNSFKRLPKCIENGMGTLKILNISGNPKVKLNVIPYSKYLEKFYASDNQNCSKFPDWLLKHKFFNLKEFNLDNTTFDVFSFVGNDGKLGYRSISMTNSNLSSPVLQMIIENMISLESINVKNDKTSNSSNILNDIPVSTLRNPALITELNFRATSLSTIPINIRLLCNLKKLNIGENNISWFPEEFSELHKLEYLIMDGNSFILFSESFGNLKSLVEIRAENNELSKLPNTFKNLKNLKTIDMYDNLFEEFPNVILEMDHLEGLDFEQNYCLTNNIMIGKLSYSCLRESYVSLLQENPEKISDLRCSGSKKLPSISSSESERTYYNGINVYNGYSSESEGNENILNDIKYDTDEKWDHIKDSDDDFKPEDTGETHYVNYKYSQFLPPEPDVFCPADLHSNRIKSEVISMRVHGSLPSYEIAQGQFDDA